MEQNWTSPTNALEIRSDAAGSGHFHAPRGGRLHEGVDLVCTPGQSILCPIDCSYVRISNPYKDDNRWHGLLLNRESFLIYVWYIRPYYFKIGETIHEGETLGVAQDIAVKYGPPMTPHVHLGIKRDGVWIDPLTMLIR